MTIPGTIAINPIVRYENISICVPSCFIELTAVSAPAERSGDRVPRFVVLTNEQNLRTTVNIPVRLKFADTVEIVLAIGDIV